MEGRVSKISLRKRTEIGELGKEVAGLFLLPMHGGIWTLCPALAGMYISYFFSALLNQVYFSRI